MGRHWVTYTNISCWTVLDSISSGIRAVMVWIGLLYAQLLTGAIICHTVLADVARFWPRGLDV